MKRVIRCSRQADIQLKSDSMKRGYDAAIKMFKTHRKLMDALKNK